MGELARHERDLRQPGRLYDRGGQSARHGAAVLAVGPEDDAGHVRVAALRGLALLRRRRADGDHPVAVPQRAAPERPDRRGEWSDMTTMLASFCQFSPAEEAAKFPICDQWRDDFGDMMMESGKPSSPYDLESRGGASP